ncbi:uncharacterized protein (DUF427 family) [Bradyrhizobium sp. LB13.1]
MKLPGPDHPITITQNPRRVRVTAGDIVIAETSKALILKEAKYPAVQYVPRQDANMALLERTDRVTHCPYKGDASYYSVKANGQTLDNAIWTYETPFPAMTEISGHLAFYPDKVKIEEGGVAPTRASRQGRACPGHPRSWLPRIQKDVDARDGPGHDDWECWSSPATP